MFLDARANIIHERMIYFVHFSIKNKNPIPEGRAIPSVVGTLIPHSSLIRSLIKSGINKRNKSKSHGLSNSKFKPKGAKRSDMFSQIFKFYVFIRPFHKFFNIIEISFHFCMRRNNLCKFS